MSEFNDAEPAVFREDVEGGKEGDGRVAERVGEAGDDMDRRERVQRTGGEGEGRGWEGGRGGKAGLGGGSVVAASAFSANVLDDFGARKGGLGAD